MLILKSAGNVLRRPKSLAQTERNSQGLSEVQRMVSEIEFGIKRESEQSQTTGDFENFSASKRDREGAKMSKNVSLTATTRLTGRSAYLSAPNTKFFRGTKRWKDTRNTTTS